MSYDENRISDLIDGGLIKQKQQYETMKIFQTSKARILFVSVPEGATDIKCYPRLMSGYKQTGGIYWERDLPDGDWVLLSLLKDADEEQCREILPVYSLIHSDLFQNYQNDFYIESQFKTALESLHSLANHLGCEGNTAILVEPNK